MRYRFYCALLAWAMSAGLLRAQDVEIKIEGGKHDLHNVPMCVPLSVSPEQARRGETHATGLKGPIGGLGTAQLTRPGVMTEAIPPSGPGLVRRDLHFILPKILAGQQLTLTCNLNTGVAWEKHALYWTDEADGSRVLATRPGMSAKPGPILRYMHAAYDASTPQQRDRTYKVFHHLYDPAHERLVTNGGHTDPFKDEKKLLYPHHRGLMYAFNRISYGEGLKKTADTWHAKPGATHEAHEKTLSEEVGAVLGRQRVLISWHGAKNDVFANEERELTVYKVPGGTLVEFASKLKSAGGKVRLDGDPQHAGFQFRAANEVAEKTAKQTYYLRPDGKGEPGATRNWEPKTKQGPVDLPWDAMSFVLGGQRYTVAYLNSPSNPKESRFSERDYGRFGCYFEYDLTPERPLVVNYRVWLQDGEMTGAQVQTLYDAFAQPPQATVKK